MHVLLTIASLSRSGGGTSRAVVETARHLAENDCTVTILAFQEGKQINVDASSAHLSLRTVEKGSGLWHAPANLLRFRGRLREAMDTKAPTVVHDNGIWRPVNHIVSSLAQEMNVPRVVSTHGMLEPWSVRHKSLKKRIAWWAYQRGDLSCADVLHATAESEAHSLRELNVDTPVLIAPNGVTLPENRDEPKARDGDRICLFLSRIHRVKGLVNLVEAWSRVQPPEWEVHIAGPDENGHKKEVQRRIQERGLSSSFTFLGPVQGAQKDEVFRRSDLFVLPTHSENFGIVVAEALSYGIPVITTNGAPWHDLEEYDCGWWVDVGVDPLAEALEEALHIPAREREAMGRRGRRLVEQKYTWSRVAESLQETYRWVLGRAGRPECVTS